MDILATIEAAHAARKRVKVSVPEWGCDLWFPEVLTLNQKSNIEKDAPKGDENALMVSYIVAHATDEAGARVFDNPALAKATLMGKASVKTIMEIFSQIGAPITVDEAKND